MKENNWIPVSERLPEFETEVLLFGRTQHLEPDEDGQRIPDTTWIAVGELSEVKTSKLGNNYLFEVDFTDEKCENVTHWMELPAPPAK